MRLTGLVVFMTIASANAQSPVHLLREEPHPFMSNVSANSMHNDTYNSDVHEEAGPVTQKTTLQQFKISAMVGLCPTFSFAKLKNQKDIMVSVCVKAAKTTLCLLNPLNFEIISSLNLPKRQGVILAGVTFQFEQMLKDTSGGAYFYLNHLNQVVVPTSNRSIQIVDIVESGTKPKLKLNKEIKLGKQNGGVITDSDLRQRRSTLAIIYT